MYEKATYWLLRQRDGDMSADGWEAFTTWLEEDARHSEIYDALVVADEALGDGRGVAPEIAPGTTPEHELPAAANDNPLTRFVPWVMAAAAAVVLAVFVWPQGSIGPSGDITQIATAPGEIRTVAVSDTITMTLNGASAVELAQGAPNVTVSRGEVAFAINSPTPSALRVSVDDLVLTDIGTEFNVTLSDDRVRVAVSDGIVGVNPDEENLKVFMGQAVEKKRRTDTLIRTDIDPETVASWRDGRLEFDDTPIARALAQLERSTGVFITAAPRFADARLTGSVAIEAEPQEIARRFAAIVGGTARPLEDAETPRWVIE